MCGAIEPEFAFNLSFKLGYKRGVSDMWLYTISSHRDEEISLKIATVNPEKDLFSYVLLIFLLW